MPYYEAQTNWGNSDYYCLHRYLHRMIWNHERRLDEIRRLRLDKMSNETKTILYCIIVYYGFTELMELDNLKDLKNTKPLKEPLIIDGDTADDDIYRQMNIYL